MADAALNVYSCSNSSDTQENTVLPSTHSGNNELSHGQDEVCYGNLSSNLLCAGLFHRCVV